MCRFLTHYATWTLFGHPVARAPTGFSREHCAKALAAAPGTYGGCRSLLAGAAPDFSHPRCAACDDAEALLYARTTAAVLQNLDQARPCAVPLLTEPLARGGPRPLRGERRRAVPRRVREGAATTKWFRRGTAAGDPRPRAMRGMAEMVSRWLTSAFLRARVEAAMAVAMYESRLRFLGVLGYVCRAQFRRGGC
ncbi:hypothetical protein DL765_004288 [Monosporascus sp. GIB2]|nr:hypothetical protein DL765_004288 [Monosporascus sp. GIB2]